MIRNKHFEVSVRHVTLRVENAGTRFSRRAKKGQVLSIPIAHFDGNYYAAPETLKEIEDNGQVVLRYCDAGGALSEESNVNGSLHAIAGLMNKAGKRHGHDATPSGPPRRSWAAPTGFSSWNPCSAGSEPCSTIKSSNSIT